jgi:4-alpha-glucanotransferase
LAHRGKQDGGMSELAPSLAELASQFGIATDYENWSGHRIAVPDSTLVAVLAALGVAAADELERRAAHTAHERAHWSRALPPTILGRPGSQTTFWVHVTHGQPAEVWLQLEDGSVRTGIRQVDNFNGPFDLDGHWIGEASFALPDDLPLAGIAGAAGRPSYLGIGHAVI